MFSSRLRDERRANLKKESELLNCFGFGARARGAFRNSFIIASAASPLLAKNIRRACARAAVRWATDSAMTQSRSLRAVFVPLQSEHEKETAPNSNKHPKKVAACVCWNPIAKERRREREREREMPMRPAKRNLRGAHSRTFRTTMPHRAEPSNGRGGAKRSSEMETHARTLSAHAFRDTHIVYGNPLNTHTHTRRTGMNEQEKIINLTWQTSERTKNTIKKKHTNHLYPMECARAGGEKIPSITYFLLPLSSRVVAFW